ncbi:MAG: M20/M25/M40 family metallo-hydrolase [Vulcanimicrobiaceae bacterium]
MQASVNDAARFASDLIAIDSRSSVSNVPLTELLESRLHDWQIERTDYTDASGTLKRSLVCTDEASTSPLAFAGHVDTVSDVGWQRDPFSPAIENGRLIGLGASDMKGSIAAFMTAFEQVDRATRPTLVFTADEETTKQGVREVVARSRILKERATKCIIACEPTTMQLVRGHRVDVQFIVHAHGVQAHSSTGRGVNANLLLIPFLVELRELHLRLREDKTLHDPQYDPPFCDLNFVIDNYGAFPNVTVGLATCRIKFRYSKSFDPRFVIEKIQDAAKRNGLELEVRREAPPPELPGNDPVVLALEKIAGTKAVVMGLGTEASEYSKLAPTLVIGPGRIEEAHKPSEAIGIDVLDAAVELYRRIALELPKALA